MCYATALFIFRRRAQRSSSQLLLEHVTAIQSQEAAVHEHEFVVFLHDCFAQALGKSLKLKREEAGVRRISKRWKDYDNYVQLIPLIIRHKINPQAFFTFAVAARQAKRIPPTVSNIATDKAVQHFLQFRQLNTHRVATYLTNRTYEDELASQLQLDTVSLTTYLLRKPTVALSSSDAFLFSSAGRVMICQTQDFPLESSEQVFSEDLQFSPAFRQRAVESWNAALQKQIGRVKALDHELRDPHFQTKLQEIAELLSVLTII